MIVGEGDEYNLINNLVVEWKLDNVTILPSVSQSEFLNFLDAVDVGLFACKDHTSHNFPGKIFGYMINSLPILGVNPGNDLLPLINETGAGYVYNGEDDLLVRSCEFVREKTLIKPWGALILY